MTTAKRIITALPGPLHHRIPDNNFILSPRHEVPAGEEMSVPAGDKLIAGMKGSTGEWAMVHLPYGGKVVVDATKALAQTGGGKYRAWWVDPRTGGKTVVGTGAAARDIESEVVFIAPDGADWLLLLESVKV
jgi:hypothetical protein